MISPELPVQDTGTGIEFPVYVKARASREAVGGTHAGALRVSVHSAPVDGKANQQVCRSVARALGIRPGAVELVAGAKGRRKRLRASGDAELLKRSLQRLAATQDPV